MLAMSFEKLQVWQRGIALVESIYKATKLFPKEERYGLVSQMRRAAVSIPSNIAEGSQRTSDKDFANFVLISKGSLAELQTQLIISKKLEYISQELFSETAKEIDELSRMLHAFHSKLTTHSS
jgi:four helix bundle protein